MSRNCARFTAGILALVATAVFTGCGDGNDPPGGSVPDSPAPAGEITAVITSSDLAVGQQRFAFVLLENDIPVSGLPVVVRFFKLKDENNPELVGEGVIPWVSLGIPGLTSSTAELSGVYFASVNFDEAGKWGAGFTIGSVADVDKEVRLSFEVKPEPSTLGVGDAGIPVENATLQNATLKQIDTSTEPDEEFHRISIASALTAGKPAVIAFATPAFCESRTCGPTMDVMRAAYEKFGDAVSWVHVEPFELDDEGVLVLRGGERVNSEAGNLWRLPSEPWVFILDAQGRVVARFDGPLTLEEVDYSVGKVLGR